MPLSLFFDLDGTLTDSCEGIIRCVNHALSELKHPGQPDDRLRAMIGQPLTMIFGAVLPAADEETIDRLIAAYRTRFDRVGIFENALYPGIAGALKQLHDAGHELRVVTAKPHVAACRVLEHFEIDCFFESVHGPELTDRGCDKAALLGRALASARRARTDSLVTENKPGRFSGAVMIGDRVDDMLAARPHGVRAVGAGWGYGSRAELISAGAEYVADDVGGLLGYLLG